MEQFLSLVMSTAWPQWCTWMHMPRNDGLIPRVVLPELLENAVKHHEFSADNPLEIEVRLEGDRLTVSHDKRPRHVTASSTGDGLKT